MTAHHLATGWENVVCNAERTSFIQRPFQRFIIPTFLLLFFSLTLLWFWFSLTGFNHPVVHSQSKKKEKAFKIERFQLVWKTHSLHTLRHIVVSTYESNVAICIQWFPWYLCLKNNTDLSLAWHWIYSKHFKGFWGYSSPLVERDEDTVWAWGTSTDVL